MYIFCDIVPEVLLLCKLKHDPLTQCSSAHLADDVQPVVVPRSAGATHLLHPRHEAQGNVDNDGVLLLVRPGNIQTLDNRYTTCHPFSVSSSNVSPPEVKSVVRDGESSPDGGGAARGGEGAEVGHLLSS